MFIKHYALTSGKIYEFVAEGTIWKHYVLWKQEVM